MPELPQIVVPAIVYNAMICALATALSWHALSILSAWRRERSKSRNS